MEKRPDFHNYQKEIYTSWEEAGCFTAERDPEKTPYTIILPPPNASGKMHTGNVLMVAIEDLLIRWKRMQGYSALWIPGTDHAGFETQITFERKLKKEGKSRFDYDRQTLFQKIWDFVQENKHLIEQQLRDLGASVDWSRYTFTLDANVIETVTNTFLKMHDEGLVYKDNYMVNYCPKCGTTFADLEVQHKERTDPLYYMKYGPFTLATVRPETKFGDTAVAVHPDDERYKQYIGTTIDVEGLNGTFTLQVIADEYVDPTFGTGVVKITPAHDKNDYEIGKRHNLETKSVIGLDGKLNEHAGKYAGLSVTKAREVIAKDLQEKGLLEKIDTNYTHSVAVCYKAGHDIEPTVLPNWFVRVDPIKTKALEVVENDEVKIYPDWRKVTYTRWMEQMHDWPISRQVVWGIRIPVWYDIDLNPELQITFLNPSGDVITGTAAALLKKYSYDEIKNGLQTLIAPTNATYTISQEKPTDGRYLQETDTFDTWFSSGHWPLVTLGYPNSDDFNYFYPTAVLETGWEIIRLWVSRMVMFGTYLTDKPPFNDVYLHGLVRARDGKKMSKSLGNIINPEHYTQEYGVDALRMGLISGTANGKDFNFPHDNIIGYKKFGSKIWNMTRFLLWQRDNENLSISFREDIKDLTLTPEDEIILKRLHEVIASVDESLMKYRFADAGDIIYHFMWHEIADTYIESIKTREDKETALTVFTHILVQSLKLLHPFMPFITEKLYQTLKAEHIIGDEEPAFIMLAPWPKS